jgi:hypothetical protein
VCLLFSFLPFSWRRAKPPAGRRDINSPALYMRLKQCSFLSHLLKPGHDRPTAPTGITATATVLTPAAVESARGGKPARQVRAKGAPSLENTDNSSFRQVGTGCRNPRRAKASKELFDWLLLYPSPPYQLRRVSWLLPVRGMCRERFITAYFHTESEERLTSL